MTDKDLRRDVLDELDFDPSLDAARSASRSRRASSL